MPLRLPNLAEGWRKRGYKKVFVNKLSDAMQEANETQTWLEFALACQYIDQATYEALFADYEKIVGQVKCHGDEGRFILFLSNSASQPPNFSTSAVTLSSTRWFYAYTGSRWGGYVGA